MRLDTTDPYRRRLGHAPLLWSRGDKGACAPQTVDSMEPASGMRHDTTDSLAAAPTPAFQEGEKLSRKLR